MGRMQWIERVKKTIVALGGTVPEEIELYLDHLEARLLGECRRKSFPTEAYDEMVLLGAYGAIVTTGSGAEASGPAKAITVGDTRVEYGSAVAAGTTLSATAAYDDAFRRFVWHWRVVPW